LSAAANYHIREASPADPAVRDLIAELDAYNTALYPAESNHFDSPETLAAARVMFLVVESTGRLVGCGAAKHCGEWAEIKRMFLKPEARGAGLAMQMLERLLEWARQEGLSLARLETGHRSDGALQLYRRAGFQEIPAFPPYAPDPLSIFMERTLRQEPH
jgi:putative acetyltransferase